MFIGEFSCLFKESPAYLTQTVGMFIGEFSCLLRITCLSHTDSWYVHWGVFLSLKNHLYISHRQLVCSLGSFPVSKESPAYLTQTVGMFIGEFSYLLRITYLSLSCCWYVHWGVFRSLKNHLFISHRQLVCSLGSFPVS